MRCLPPGAVDSRTSVKPSSDFRSILRNSSTSSLVESGMKPFRRSRSPRPKNVPLHRRYEATSVTIPSKTTETVVNLIERRCSGSTSTTSYSQKPTIQIHRTATQMRTRTQSSVCDSRHAQIDNPFECYHRNDKSTTKKISASPVRDTNKFNDR